MNTLNLGSDEMLEKKKKNNTRSLKIALGLAAVILVPTIGSTLAEQIDINTGNTTQFAQGLVTTAACDNAIDITPVSSVDSGVFYLDKILISNVLAACDGKVFNIRVVDSGGNLEQIGNSSTVCSFVFDDDDSDPIGTGFTQDAEAGGCTILNADAGSFEFEIYGMTQIASLDVYGITIESTE